MTQRPGRLIRVDFTRMALNDAPAPSSFSRLGGRALTSRLLLEEVPGHADPRGPKNKLVLAPGLLAGYPVPSGSRLSAGAKSPLTGGIKESSAGGVTGGLLAKAGVKAVVLEGEAPAGAGPYVLVVDAAGAQILPAPELRGMGVYAAARLLLAQYGREAGLLLVGPGGERGCASACLCNTDPEGNPTRVNGRGGLGAVMGRKGLKAIVVRPPAKGAPGMRGPFLVPEDPEAFQPAISRYVELIKTTPQTAENFPKYGTPLTMSRTNELGCLPTRNFSAGSFEGASRIGGKAISELILARGGEGNPTHGCMPGCLVRCSNIYPGPDGKAIVAPLEYETLGLLGSNLGIADPDEVARLNCTCNDLGIDTIEIGGALGVCMEAGLAAFGDAAAAARLLDEIARDTILGRVIAEGVAITGRVLGVRRVPAVKGQGLPAYDPRAMKGLGVTFATSPQGADHTAGQTLRVSIDHHSAEGQVEASRQIQELTGWYDALGLCNFVAPALVSAPEVIAALASAVTGEPWTVAELEALGREVLLNEREFNLRAGFTPADDRLPEFFYEEPLGSERLTFDLTDEDLRKALPTGK